MTYSPLINSDASEEDTIFIWVSAIVVSAYCPTIVVITWLNVFNREMDCINQKRKITQTVVKTPIIVIFDRENGFFLSV